MRSTEQCYVLAGLPTSCHDPSSTQRPASPSKSYIPANGSLCKDPVFITAVFVSPYPPCPASPNTFPASSWDQFLTDYACGGDEVSTEALSFIKTKQEPRRAGMSITRALGIRGSRMGQRSWPSSAQRLTGHSGLSLPGVLGVTTSPPLFYGLLSPWCLAT